MNNDLKRSPEERIIFLADDDPDDRELFMDALNDTFINTNLITANDGEQLIKLLNNSNILPDIIFLDLNMPLKDGFECLDEIKKSSKLKNIPVVILSTSNHSETITKVQNLGASNYISKPPTFEQLKSALRQILVNNWQTKTNPPKKNDFIIET